MEAKLFTGIFITIIGLVMLARGKIGGPVIITKDENPLIFWGTIGFAFLVGVFQIGAALVEF